MPNRVYDLTCNDLTDPLGIDTDPVFSWKYSFDDAGSQKAYRIAVSTSAEKLNSGDFDCWDSGRIETDMSLHIPYEGTTLQPRSTYHWKVTVDGDGDSAESQGTFETAKRGEKWSGRWIAAHHHRRPDESLDAPYLRKTFDAAESPVRARLYICGPGYFDSHLNGSRILDDELPTPYTRFDARLLYRTFDVTDHVRAGANALGVILGNGWYNCFTTDVWNTREVSWRHVTKFIAELHLEYGDGSSQVVITDRTWKGAPSPIVFNGIRNGEYFDAREDQPGWDTPDFDDSEWDHAKIIRPTGGVLRAMEMQPIRITGTIDPVGKWETSDGAHIYDTGQNMAGIVEVSVEAEEGSEIVIRHAERLKDDGVNVNPGTISGFVRSGEFQTDKYTASGSGKETWRPRFVYHGFQYVEITGSEKKPDLKAHWVHSDVGERGRFECSDATVNALQHACRSSTVSNLHSLPTDSPHREKNAWTGDVSVSSEQMLLNFNAVPLLRKWLTDVRESQKPDGALPCVVPSTGWGYNWGNGPDWSSAVTHVPWLIYLYTGDTRILRENYEAITRHFGYMESMADNGIVHYGIGDWCAPFEGRAIAVNMSSFKCPTEVTDTAYYYEAASTISRIASVLGLDDDERDYLSAADTIRHAFRREFYNTETNSVHGNCQTSTACMLYLGLHEDQEYDQLFDLLLGQISENGDHQDTGILGNRYLYNVLGRAGRMDVALRMILNPTHPSFRNWIDEGATTLRECWNGEGSRNHHMFSDVSASMYKYLGGIQVDENEPGFRHVIISPDVDCGLNSVACHHESPYGKVASSWVRTDTDISLEIQIPCGSHATLTLPDAYTNYPTKLSSGVHSISVEAT